MFAVSARRTMAGARPRLSEPVRRNNVIDLSRRWQTKQDERARAEEARQQRIRQRIEAERQRMAELHRIVPLTAPRDLISMVAAWHGYTYEDIISPAKPNALVSARQDAMVAVYLNCRCVGERYSLLRLGRIFHRDHTTVLHALRKAGLR